jgi:hypothetical protein
MRLLVRFQEAYQFLRPVLRNKTVRESLPDAIRQFAEVEDAWSFVFDWVAMQIPAMMVRSPLAAPPRACVASLLLPQPFSTATALTPRRCARTNKSWTD